MQNNIGSISQKYVGVGYRQEISRDIALNKSKIDCIEIISENYSYSQEAFRRLGLLAEQYKIVLHGVDMSIASTFLDKTHLRNIKLICEITEADYYSEHLALTKTENLSLGHLSPIILTDKVLELIVRNVNIVQDYLGIPLVLENITYYFDFKHDNINMTEFFERLVNQTGCGILLDLANLYINSQNHSFDPYEFINNLPLSNVIQVHLAGGFKDKQGIYIDSHSKIVNEPTWDLLSYLCKRADIKRIILEHDNDFPEDFNLILNQLDRARNCLKMNHDMA